MRPSLIGALYPHVVPPHVCTEGPTWTQNVMPPLTYAAIDYGSGIFMAGGFDSVGPSHAGLSRSFDSGVTWAKTPTQPLFTSNSQIISRCIAFGNGAWVCAGNFLEYAFSLDNGATWTVTAVSRNKDFIYFGGGVFITITSNASTIARSTDGQNWSTASLPSLTSWQVGGFGAGRHILLSNTQDSTYSDDAGITWQVGGGLPFVTDVNDIAYGNGVWVMLPQGITQRVAVSTDGGLTWTAHLTLPSSSVWRGLIYSQGVFMVTTSDGTIATSANGVTWTASIHPLPAALTSSSSILMKTDGAHRYAAVSLVTGQTAGAWGVC